MSGYQELIERLEKASGADRELDIAIRKLVAPGSIIGDYWPATSESSVPKFTDSLDAAASLVPVDMIFGIVSKEIPSRDPSPRAWVQQDYHKRSRIGRGETPAIALCIAALKARSFTEAEGKKK